MDEPIVFDPLPDEPDQSQNFLFRLKSITKKPSVIFLAVVIVIILGLTVTITLHTQQAKKALEDQEISHTEDPSPQVTITQEGKTVQVTAIPSVPPTSYSSSPQPTKRIPHPPTGGISYPQEGLTIDASETNFCFVDFGSDSDDTKTIQRRKNFNNNGWDSYSNVYPSSSTCFSPKDGTNTISVQFRNKYGDESQVYTRNFIFHYQPPDTTPPTITQLDGPQNGEVINSDHYCFQAHVSDNVSQSPNLWIRDKFSDGNWNEWTQPQSLCYGGYGSNSVTYLIQAKDAAGNESSPITRTFQFNN